MELRSGIVYPLILMLLLLFTWQTEAQSLKAFPPSSVRINDGPFYEAQQADLQYIIQLNPDRLLAPFLIDAGLAPKAERYPNWENTGLDGHMGGHYLSALSWMYAATQHPELKARLDYMLDELEKCQAKNGNGYIGGIPGGQSIWKEISEGKIVADNFSLNGKWVPLYNIHKLFAGLKDAYALTGSKKALDLLVRLTDWYGGVITTLSDQQIQAMLRSEHGGMNEALADVYEITGNVKYLEWAKKMSHTILLNPLLSGEDRLTGLHANTQIPKVIGYKKIANLTNNPAWSDASRFFWENVVKHRTVSIGGNSVREHFHPTDNFSSMIESNEGPETCNTYNMLKLTKLLFLSEQRPEYLDYYERAIYNHILSSQHPGGGFVYFTPMRPQHYRVYSSPQKSFWCCVGSGLENHGKYNELIYAYRGADIFVNFFIPSTLTWLEKEISIKQITRFPYQESSVLIIDTQNPQDFSLNVRIPGWVKSGEAKIKVNGVNLDEDFKAGSYASISRTWKRGDRIEIMVPMHTRMEYLPDGSPWASFVHGPIVLAAASEQTDLDGLQADDSRMSHVAAGKFYPLDKTPIILKNKNDSLATVDRAKGEPLTFNISAMVEPERYKSFKLVPFYTLHDTRYMIYWPVTTADKIEEMQRLLREEEKRRFIEAATIDKVAVGQQQPEADHFFEGDKSFSGTLHDKQWRKATGWFKYTFKNKDNAAQVVRVTFISERTPNDFDIMVNGNLLKSEHIKKTNDDEFFSIEYAIPEGLKPKLKETIEIKFVSKRKSSTPRIHDVRLLKNVAVE
jgi:uncharacterized protein